MTLEELRQKNKEYRFGLIQIAHMYDDNKQVFLDRIQNLYDTDENCFAYQGGIPNSVIKSALIETLEAYLFNISVIEPLRRLLYHFETKGRWKTSINTTYNIKFEFDSRIHTSRSIFQLIRQLPEYVVLEELDVVYSENNDESLLDAYIQQNEDDFARSFGQLKQNEKEYLINVFIRIAKALNLSPVINEIKSKKYKGLDEVIEDNELLASLTDEMLPGTGFLSLRIEDILQNGTSLATIQSMKTPYKNELKEYLFKKALMDDFTKDVIEEIIQNPDYLDITNKLLAECEEELKMESIDKECTHASENNELMPFPFPYNNIQIEAKQTNVFLEQLYEKLLNSDGKQYLEKGRKESFVYLFGGSEEKPNQRQPLVWLRQKNELQAFLLALFGEQAGEDPGWSTFNNYFWWKKQYNAPELANNSGNISSDIKGKFVRIMNDTKKELSPSPTK